MNKISPKDRTRNRKSGQALISAALFFVLITMAILFGITAPVMRGIVTLKDFSNSRGAFFAAEGLAGDIIFRLKNGITVPAVVSLSVSGYEVTATTTTIADGKESLISGYWSGLVRKIKVHLSAGSGASFHYGLQAGDGGINLHNNSTIQGNTFSNGPVTGEGSNIIKGTVISAGPSGIISGIHATSSAYAHTISNSDVDGDAYYQIISDTSVDGASYPGSEDQATSSMPIDDSLIDEWEAEALAGGVISSPCPYEIDSDVTIGPKKINCDLEITGGVITLSGAILVSGNITISNTADIKVSPSLGASSVPVIADKITNRSSSSKIILANSAEFFGSGEAGSFVLLVSRNDSAK